MDEMGSWEKMFQDRDKVRKFFGGLLGGLRYGMHGGCDLLYGATHSVFFSLPLYRSLKTRTVWTAEPASPRRTNASVVPGSQCHF